MQQNYLSVNRQHCEFNPFHANVPFPYPPLPRFHFHTTGFLWFSVVFRGYKNGTLAWHRLNSQCWRFTLKWVCCNRTSNLQSRFQGVYKWDNDIKWASNNSWRNLKQNHFSSVKKQQREMREHTRSKSFLYKGQFIRRWRKFEIQ